MSLSRLDIDRAALEDLIHRSTEGKALMGQVGRAVRDEARRNATAITSKTDAIISEVGNDSEGVYTDVGYAKHHPGFFLWWYEVGTRYDAPRPHLRPALRPGLID